jgi:hypothetical protein
MMQLRSALPNCAGVWRRIIFGVTGGSEAQTVFDRYPWCSAVEFAQRCYLWSPSAMPIAHEDLYTAHWHTNQMRDQIKLRTDGSIPFKTKCLGL